VSTLDDCYPWQPGGCVWTIRYLWRWMSSFGRLDVIVLALMLAYLFAVVIHVCCRYYVARRARGIDSAGRRTLAAVLNIEVGSLKSIAITAPYLGLAGTCVGILSAFGGVGMEKRIVLGNMSGLPGAFNRSMQHHLI
jgi:MotA/TolQ/ExbB proton channel family